MVQIKDPHNPSFIMLAFHTDRTAWRPYGLPVILVAPHIRDPDNNKVINSDVLYDDRVGVRVYIADVGTGKTPVAGHDHRGLFNPDTEVYVREVSFEELRDRKISTLTVTDGQLEITTRSGVHDTIQYLEHADYYDLSDILLENEQLQHGRYSLVYEARYYNRKVSDTERLVCIDESSIIYTRTRFPFNHPGDVLLQMIESTPSLYLTAVKKSEDTTIAFYRPFSEMLQDIHDEQQFLEKANWLHSINPEYVPYLGFLLGWDLPYFPRSVDGLRRAMLRNTTRLQKLKGTKRALRELFDLFGFMINISHVWWAPDGSKYIGPGEDSTIPITIDQTATYEPILLNAQISDEQWQYTGYTQNGYGQIDVPLINRPTDDIIIESYLVQRGTDAYTQLENITAALSADIRAYDANSPIDKDWTGVTPDTAGVIGYSKHRIGSNGIATGESESGWPVYDAQGRSQTIKFDKNTNRLNMGFNRYVEFDNLTLYVFAAYKYGKLSIPQTISNLQSNRFDVEILAKDGEQVRPDIIVFLIDFLFQIKAFHSLLRKIIYAVSLYDVYQVTDYCVGGQITQDPNTDHGRQQVPSQAIIPNIPSERCNQLDPAAMGYRPQDLKYRETILNGLADEFKTWKDLAEYLALSACALNPNGQNRSAEDSEAQVTADRGEVIYSSTKPETLCELDSNNYCYKSRVDDVMGLKATITSKESWKFKFCGLNLGNGAYFTYPSIKQNTDRYKDGLLGRLTSNYEHGNNSLYYINKGVHELPINPLRYQALVRPTLDIEKDNLCFPGHRLPTLGNLNSDFTHPDYELRPWDLNPTCACPPYLPNSLNAYLTTESDGQQYLNYDYVQYVVSGNGRTPDISSLGNHNEASITASNVTHAIYLGQYNDDDIAGLDNCSRTVGIINVSPLFQSARDCGTGYRDIADGYPSRTGWLSASDNPPIELFPSIDDQSAADELREALGIPVTSGTPSLIYKLSSQVRVPTTDANYQFYKAYRLDCGCLTRVCYGSDLMSCPIPEFLTRYGNKEPDQLIMDARISPVDSTGCVSIQLDGYLTNLFSLKQIMVDGEYQVSEKGYPQDNPYPPSGNFIYKDSYDIIYEQQWNTIPDAAGRKITYLDLITVIKEPRRLGTSDHAGRIDNKQLYYEGTITTVRQLFTRDSNGIRLTAEGSESSHGEFQASYLCKDPFTDPFTHKLDNSLTDSPNAIILDGPRWAEPNDSGDDYSTWSDPAASNNAMTWINIHTA